MEKKRIEMACMEIFVLYTLYGCMVRDGAVPHESVVAFFSLCLEGEMHMIFAWSALRNTYSLHS
jgi:enhancing lycopene biosynthesis protein 2